MFVLSVRGDFRGFQRPKILALGQINTLLHLISTQRVTSGSLHSLHPNLTVDLCLNVRADIRGNNTQQLQQHIIRLVYSGETGSDLFLGIIAGSTSHLILLKVKWDVGRVTYTAWASTAIESNVCWCFSSQEQVWDQIHHYRDSQTQNTSVPTNTWLWELNYRK